MTNPNDTKPERTTNSSLSPAEQGFMQKLRLWLEDTGKQLGIAIVIVLILRSSVIEPYKIPSGSMIPTLFIGDHIFVNKLAYGLKIPFSDYIADKPIFVTTQQVPARGDVVVFKYPKDESVNYIKRVVGLPGETIAIRNKVLFINEERVGEIPFENPTMFEGVEPMDRGSLSLFNSDLLGKLHPVLHDPNSFHGSDYGPLRVPNDSLFVMGDNRDRSSDSRAWGFVPLENVKGKAMFIWLNFVIKFSDGFDFRFRPTRVATWIN